MFRQLIAFGHPPFVPSDYECVLRMASDEFQQGLHNSILSMNIMQLNCIKKLLAVIFWLPIPFFVYGLQRQDISTHIIKMSKWHSLLCEFNFYNEVQKCSLEGGT